jgi:chemotaxis protein methyltransferase CheR
MFNVSILEARTIIRTIDRTYGTDLSGLAMASFRIRLSEILQRGKFRSPRALVDRLLEDPRYVDTFIRDISIGSPDMFRDPDVWIYLRDELIPSVLKSCHHPEIVIPESVTGNELYSMLVLLREMEIDNRVDLVVTCRNQKILDRIIKAELPNVRFKNSRDNYEIFYPGSTFERYTGRRGNINYLKPELLDGIEFRVQEPGLDFCSDTTQIVMYRNRMIYLNAEMHYKRLKQVLSDMKKDAFLVIGIHEALDGFGLDKLYSPAVPELGIYKKKNAG